MKQLYLSTILIVMIIFSTFAQSPLETSFSKAKEAASQNWQDQAIQFLNEQAYSFKQLANEEYAAYNANDKYLFATIAKRYTINKMQAEGSLSLWNITFDLQSVNKGGSNLVNNGAFVNTFFQKERIRYSNSAVSIEYINDTTGTRQNFIIQEKPAGKESLSVVMNITTDFDIKLINKQGIGFYKPGAQEYELAYDGLKVWDAHRKPLPAHMELLDDQSIQLVVNDESATYPITIDPLNHTPRWTTSADGVLPSILNNLQLQVNAAYGYTVAGVGDVNGDGFDDIAVGAPAAVDIISSTSILQAGAVFVYFGSATNFPVAPSRVLRATTRVANALFGYSIAGGNITGDGRSDIIVGAPLDQFQTAAAGSLFNVTVTAGRVYVFRGEDLTSISVPSPFLTLNLNGTDFFSAGILGVLLSNINVNGLFGYSVAATEDMNGDGRGELLIGAPGYLGTSLLSVRSGAAFVYYSSNLSTNTPVQLQTPNPSLLGLVDLPLANTGSLLFGYSVDGAGDFNGDGRPDLVVGAPAGVNLNTLGGIFSGQVLGGSAYVYYGAATGVTQSVGTRLQASPSGLLSNTANFFGFNVRGARTATGARSGAILIGAPSGNVLSNVLNGLRLSAGSVSVFKQRTSTPSTSLSADQTISSPRGNSLLSILAGQSLSVSALFGASLDNVLDVNCDNINDIIVGEPLSTGVGLIGADVAGGAAFVFTGRGDGTYNTTPYFTMTTVVSTDVGVNAASLLGFSVAGTQRNRSRQGIPPFLVGAPGRSLDFGTGLLDLGTTLGTLFSFTSGNNGLGKAYGFDAPVCQVLPVTIIQFKAEKSNNKVGLTWTTADESEISHYEVLHSIDGINYKSIGIVFSASEQLTNRYAFSHESPSTGTNYYKLKIIENDRSFNYSSIATVRFNEGLLNMVIAPNPVLDIIKVQLTGLTSDIYVFELVNANGQVQLRKNVTIARSSHTEVMPVDGIAAGVYTLTIYNKAGHRIQSQKIIKQ
jgi:hypothetical protein